MSAFICSDRHIATVVKAYTFYAGESEAFARDLANTLKRENIRSVNYRYNQRTRFKPCALSDALPVGAGEGQYRAVDLLQLASCIDYQSCERPNWENSLASRALQRITSHFKELASHQPWYQSNIWCI
jgi:hypothetical protein